MLNAEGKVVGINVAIAEGSNSVGFTIPSLQLLSILDFLKTRPPDRRVVHKPQLGAQFTNTSAALLRFSGLDPNQRKGVYVRRCYEGFPLHKAGVREGDILHSFDGRALDNFGEASVEWNPYARSSIESLMALMVATSKPEIEYSRKGKHFTATVVFEDPAKPGYPVLPAVREWHPPYEKPDYEVICGLVLMELTTNHINMFHENPSQSVIESLTPMVVSVEPRMEPHVVVTNVLVGSSASRVGVFGPGTLLAEVNGHKVSTLAELRKALVEPVSAEVADNSIYVTFKSNNNDFVVLDLHSVIAEEYELSQSYLYEVSTIIQDELAKASPQLLDYVCNKDAMVMDWCRSLAAKSKKRLAKKGKKKTSNADRIVVEDGTAAADG